MSMKGNEGFYRKRRDELGGVYPEWKHSVMSRAAKKVGCMNIGGECVCCLGCGRETTNRSMLCDDCEV